MILKTFFLSVGID